MMKHSKKNKVAFLVPAVAMVGIMGFNGIGATYQQAAAESASNNKYYTDYLTFEEELEAAYAFNVEVAGEGSVLLKNENSALPLQKNEKNVTLFGVGSPNWQYGGYGSGAGSGPNEIDIKASLQHAGYNVNGVVSNIYERGFAEQNAGTYGQDAVELPVSALSSATDSYHVYNDAAIVVITRSLGSYIDAKFYNAPGHENENDHALVCCKNDCYEYVVRYGKYQCDG